MYIVVHHEISDAGTFFEAAKSLSDEKKLPTGVRLHFGLPNTENTRAVCLWEAPSVDTVKNLLEPKIGRASRNTYFMVDNEKAAGLPIEAARP